PKKNIFWLETMKYLCDRFNNPQNSYKSYHIAGSKGKGSVSSYIANILASAGYKTGLYTSPHILNFSERIGSNSGPFSEEVYEKTVKEIVHLVDSIIPENLPNQRDATWFELVTLFAFLTFKNAECSHCVFETGMGGRLDATNVISPEVTIITPIELEHTEFLGDTLEKIAKEKAGIIKENIPVVSFNQKPEAKVILEEVAKEKNCDIYFLDDFLNSYTYKIENEKSVVELNFKKLFSRPIKTSLNFLGEFQVLNCAIATFACKLVNPEITEEQIELGLSKAFLPGRFEIINKDESKKIPKLILDGAHTKDSLNFTFNTFKSLYNSKANLLFACASDKNMDEMTKIFFDENVKSLILTKPGFEKGSNLPYLAECTKKLNEENNNSIDLKIIENPKDAILKSFELAYQKDEPVLICGSFYLLAEVKALLQNL
ncbi:MAG: folylpolyglutamate synthase/dihydrofolate synthase family protein, partial [Treponemataceae bacterium]|nr:folylpolyglutamate synthase/dihydrofolate synthase family protein [Treponemataceae bacterium]